MSAVTFDPVAFKARFPEFAGVSDLLLTAYFNEASTLLLDNTDRSLVCDLTMRAVLLNYATAHLAALNKTEADGSLSRDVVGRVSEARQGSVAVSTVMSMNPTAQQAWYEQTPYGATFWAMTSQFRTLLYVPPVVSASRFPRWRQ